MLIYVVFYIQCARAMKRREHLFHRSLAAGNTVVPSCQSPGETILYVANELTPFASNTLLKRVSNLGIRSS